MLSRDNPNVGRVLCPYLGQKDDSSTSLAFPSAWNYCHKVKPPEPVAMDPQGFYCLALEHVDCTVFQRKDAIHLPRDLQGGKTAAAPWIRNVALVFLGSIALLLLIFLGARWVRMENPFSARPLQNGPATPDRYTSTISTPEVLPVARLPLFFPEVTPTPVDTGVMGAESSLPSPTVMVATATATPTVTESSTPTAAPLYCGTALENLVNGEVPFFIHKIHGGESLNTLVDRYQTSPAAIQAVNYLLPVPLRPNWVIAIPVGFSNVDAMPVFAVEQITQSDMSVYELANRLGTDPTLLIRYNGLDPTCGTFDGWFLVPRGVAATPTNP